MSFTDQPGDAQPQEGQGDTGAGGGSPWADLLDRIPEDSRSDFEQRFRDWDANYTRVSQEASEFRKQWEPYADAGLSQIPAETLQWAVQTLQNPDQARQWLDQQYGPVTQPEPQQEEFTGYLDQNAQFEQLLEQKLGPLTKRLEQYDQRWQDWESQQQHAQILDQTNAAIADVLAKNEASVPEPFRENFAETISKFALPYAEENGDPRKAIERGFADFQAMVNQIEKSALQAKVNAPAPAEGGGVADTTAPKVSSMKEAESTAAEMLRNFNRARQGL